MTTMLDQTVVDHPTLDVVRQTLPMHRVRHGEHAGEYHKVRDGDSEIHFWKIGRYRLGIWRTISDMAVAYASPI